MAEQKQKSGYIANDASNLERAIEKANAEQERRNQAAIEVQREKLRQLEEQFAKKQ